MKNLRKKFFATIAVLLLLGGNVVSANTTDTSWSFINYASTGYTSWRHKDTTGNVYCYPASGGNIYVTVGKSSNSSGTGHSAASKKVKLYKGTKYTIINSVGANNYARLKFNNVANDGTVNSGYWSPDSTKNYTVVGN